MADSLTPGSQQFIGLSASPQPVIARGSEDPRLRRGWLTG